AGADAAFDPSDPLFEQKVKEYVGLKGVDRVFEAVGATKPIQSALSIVRKGGSITLIGNVSPTIELPLQKVVTREISLYGSCAISGEYEMVLDMMAKKKINVLQLVSVEAPLSEGKRWFDTLYNKTEDLLKVVLIP
ncbi:MAG: galactitol-1-phosphate 5-dehydrogenase, partial [Spirochaetia bacterium]|nr:galactitol-1-phosphate 5-dehydrogenase [Spirochaetia bacterium]